MIPNVTQYIDMTGGTVGNTLDTTIMGASAHGAYTSWTMNPATPTGLTVAAQQWLPPDGVGITKTGGYSHGLAERAIAIDHTTAPGAGGLSAQMNFPSTAIRASMGCFIGFGPPNAGAASKLFDYLVMRDGFSGDSITLQLDNGRGGLGYGLNIESNSGGTFHSNYIGIIPGARYWVTMLWDMQAGQGRANLYHPVTRQYLGGMHIRCTKAAIGAGGLGEIRLGNNQTGNAVGATSYFQHILIDTQRAQFPLMPTVTPSIVQPPAWMRVAAAAGGTIVIPRGVTIGGGLYV